MERRHRRPEGAVSAYDHPWEGDVREDGRRRRPGQRRRRSKAGLMYLHAAELIAVAVSFLASSRIARFLVAKLTMDTVVEVTDRFGADAGHTLSGFLALIVAEPKMIAVVVAGVFLVLNAVIWLCTSLHRT